MKQQVITTLIIFAGVLLACESQEVDPVLKANAGFTFVNHERIPALPMSGRLNASLHRPPTIFFVSHEDSASLYINIS